VDDVPLSAKASLPRVLCVDDDPDVLEGLELTLCRDFAVTTATSAAEALQRIAQEADFEVVLSDMRMPGMNGAALLAAVRAQSPDTVRLLLTGYAELDAAISAVNEGGIARYLNKPCPPERLRQALQDAVRSHRATQLERQLLEQTVRGAVEALVETLASVQPVLFASAPRVRTLAAALAKECAQTAPWWLEVAALVANIGLVGVDSDHLERYFHNEPVPPQVMQRLRQRTTAAAQILDHIPRMQPVIALLRSADTEPLAPLADTGSGWETHWLVAALCQARYEGRGGLASCAPETLRTERPDLDPRVVDAMGRVLGSAVSGGAVSAVPLSGLQVGMTLVEPAMTVTHRLFAPAGLVVTASLLERMRLLRPGSLKEPLKVRRASIDA